MITQPSRAHDLGGGADAWDVHAHMMADPPLCWNGEGGFTAFGRFMVAASPRLRN